jgi:hypothetical protein
VKSERRNSGKTLIFVLLFLTLVFLSVGCTFALARNGSSPEVPTDAVPVLPFDEASSAPYRNGTGTLQPSEITQDSTRNQSTSYLTINDSNCVGYDVYVNGAYRLTEGGDGYCGFYIPCRQNVIVELRKNGRSISKERYVDCGVYYTWEITESWCSTAGVSVTDVQIVRGEFDKKGFQPIETVDEVVLGGLSQAFYADDPDNKTVLDLNDPSTKTHFEGTVLENTSGSDEWRFNVSFDKWIGGYEPCSDPIDAVLPKTPDCTGTVAPSIVVGDAVEVYGDLPFGGCYVSLCWDGYLKKIGTECCPCDLTTYKEVYNYGEEVEITIKFCGPPETPPSGEIVCGWVPYTQPFSFRKIEGCDELTYWIDCNSHADLCNNVSNYTGRYIRLVNVSIEGYTIADDPLIGGYESIQTIAGCDDCEITEACDPDSFTAWLYEDSTVTSW